MLKKLVIKNGSNNKQSTNKKGTNMNIKKLFLISTLFLSTKAAYGMKEAPKTLTEMFKKKTNAYITDIKTKLDTTNFSSKEEATKAENQALVKYKVISALASRLPKLAQLSTLAEIKDPMEKVAEAENDLVDKQIPQDLIVKYAEEDPFLAGLIQVLMLKQQTQQLETENLKDLETVQALLTTAQTQAELEYEGATMTSTALKGHMQ